MTKLKIVEIGVNTFLFMLALTAISFAFYGFYAFAEQEAKLRNAPMTTSCEINENN